MLLPQEEEQLLPPVVVPVTLLVVQVKVVPESEELNEMAVVPPLQIVALLVVPVGFGFTVISTLKVAPTHPDGDVGVTIYLTTAAAALVLVKV